MTCCLIVNLPGVLIAAADTRVRLFDGPEKYFVHDGPEDLHTDVSSRGQTVVTPYAYRKIRFLGTGWAVIAGELTSGAAALDHLKSVSASSFQSAKTHLEAAREGLLKRATDDTGIADGELSKTIVLGAAFNSSDGVWCVGLEQRDLKTKGSLGQYVVNYPDSVAITVKQNTNARLEAELAKAYAGDDTVGLVRAAARVIESAAQHSDSVSQRAQIGVMRVAAAGRIESRYFDDTTQSILAYSPAYFLSHSVQAT